MTVLRVNGRHCVGQGFYNSPLSNYCSLMPSVTMSPIGEKRNQLQARLTLNNRLIVWDDEPENCAFEIDCNLTEMFKVFNIKK